MASSYGSGSTDPTSHTQQPIMTGTSVLGIKYDGGVMLAADTLGALAPLSPPPGCSAVPGKDDAAEGEG
jgi:20S proteasome alpha/beta subunit